MVIGLLDELAVGAEDLHTVIDPVTDIDHAVHRNVGAMDWVTELLGMRRGWIIGRHRRVVWFVAVGAPIALHFASVGIQHSDALVEIAVGDIGLVLLRIDIDFGDTAEIIRVVAVADEAGDLALAHPGACPLPAPGALLAVLCEELAVLGEFENLGIRSAITADPDIAFVIDENSVI